MIRSAAAVSLGLAAVFLSGCASKPSVVGTYGFDMAKEEARIDAQGGNIGDAMRKALLKVFSSTELTFNEDGTWRLRQKAGTETVDSQGTYTCEENKVLLKPGKDGLKPLGADELTLHEDGSLTGQWAGGEDFYRLIKKEN